MEPQAAIPPHPYGVAPAGSAFARNLSIATSRRGLGQLATVDDATVLHALGYADGASLCVLAIASGALRCFASTEDLWRGVALRRAGDDGAITYRGGSWKQSVVGAPRANVAKRLFSDALYHSRRLCPRVAWAPAPGAARQIYPSAPSSRTLSGPACLL